MILVDANLLIYAHVASFRQHASARKWLAPASTPPRRPLSAASFHARPTAISPASMEMAVAKSVGVAVTSAALH